MKSFPNRGQLTIYHAKAQIDPAPDLRVHQFAPLPAGVEGASCGWVSRDAPDVAPAVLDDYMHAIRIAQNQGRVMVGRVAWLRIRMDTRKVPKHLYDIAIERAERARGKKLPRKEMLALKAEVREAVLPTLPTMTRFFHVVVGPARTMLLSCSKAVRQEFEGLFERSFGTKPTLVDWSSAGEPMPSPVADWILARFAPSKPRAVAGMDACQLEAVMDGPVQLTNPERDKITFDLGPNSQASASLDEFWSAYVNGWRLRRAACTVVAKSSVAEQPGAIVFDAVAGSLSFGIQASDPQEAADAVEMSSDRIERLHWLAEAWEATVEESRCLEAGQAVEVWQQRLRDDAQEDRGVDECNQDADD